MGETATEYCGNIWVIKRIDSDLSYQKGGAISFRHRKSMNSLYADGRVGLVAEGIQAATWYNGGSF